ncbi:GntR family transcriptional regulator [Falsochrobactrum sp. TDYN1]|uniref:GntR family transcriptional regulator n=1 Tax=Falsochrobactrum tianjinense TaxID=2706015 RepID=A0A949PK09_9HYPH|nr:GntR family transcriptional regulator [Falsochrobactrum sp. TDYN1]MBV2142387.1 GntR family transcriptional regulator [Falsochrobactrum sp. TDYN1]
MSAFSDDMQIATGEAGTPRADTIYHAVLDAIHQGRLAPGSVVNEAALAQEFGVSRGPVREAVRRLQGIQMVSREPYLKARVVTLDASTARELFELRMALEGMACNLDARRMSDTEIDALISELKRSRHTYSDTAPKEAGVFDFHERIVRACGNARIINLLCGDLYHLLRIYRRHSGAIVERKEEAFDEHWQILRAMKARDPHLAESLMRSHIRRAARNLFDHLDGESLPDI